MSEGREIRCDELRWVRSDLERSTRDLSQASAPGWVATDFDGLPTFMTLFCLDSPAGRVSVTTLGGPDATAHIPDERIAPLLAAIAEAVKVRPPRAPTLSLVLPVLMVPVELPTDARGTWQVRVIDGPGPFTPKTVALRRDLDASGSHETSLRFTYEKSCDELLSTQSSTHRSSSAVPRPAFLPMLWHDQVIELRRTDGGRLLLSCLPLTSTTLAAYIDLPDPADARMLSEVKALLMAVERGLNGPQTRR